DGRGDRQMGLGPLHTIGLAEARDRAAQCRVQRLDGIDPIEARKLATLAQEQKAAKQVTFRTCAEEWIERNSGSWRPSTLNNIENRLKLYIYPKLANLPVSAINVDLIEAMLAPIWENLPASGTKVREYLQAVLTWATAKGYRSGDNPADLKGPLGIRLKPNDHIATHYSSLPYQEIGAFMVKLRAYRDKNTGERTLSSYVLEFTILTAVRPHQARDLRWNEIDWDKKLWICPQHKIVKRTKQPHVIPLSTAAMAILK